MGAIFPQWVDTRNMEPHEELQLLLPGKSRSVPE
jgi:hypothetical protein